MNNQQLHTIYADLHVHIGRTESGQPVKISGSKNLTFYNIAKEASQRKGIEIVGIIDCHSPVVQDEIKQYVSRGEMNELTGGGIRYKQTTILLGAEIELRNEGQGEFHVLVFFPTLEEMASFSRWMEPRMKNVNLSSQRIYVSSRELQKEVAARNGVVIPAHIFTPHKSIYGNAATSLEAVLDPLQIEAVELGLSADTQMASYISELDRHNFLSNSDAHSLSKIGREYNELLLKEATYEEWLKAIRRQEGRKIKKNFGLDPRLGKYFRTFCRSCQQLSVHFDSEHACQACGSEKRVRGVMDRIYELADREQPDIPTWKPKYHYQVPLEFIPGLGPKKLEMLLDLYGTEMNILHRVAEHELSQAAGPEIAQTIIKAREGKLTFSNGGGGKYGSVLK